MGKARTSGHGLKVITRLMKMTTHNAIEIVPLHFLNNPAKFFVFWHPGFLVYRLSFSCGQNKLIGEGGILLMLLVWFGRELKVKNSNKKLGVSFKKVEIHALSAS